MKALSIRQPWAWAILHAGKNIENRVWKDWSLDAKFRGEFLIHASVGMTRGEWKTCLATLHAISERHPFPSGLMLPLAEELPRGGFVGRARVVDAVRSHDSPWFFGPLGLVLADAEPITFIPFKGMLGFFDVPDDLGF